MKKEYHLIFSGKVQGVWFRATAQNLAQKHNVGGWIKNLTDGRVEAVAQADKQSLNNFLKSLAETYEPNIADIEKKENNPGKEYQKFAIIS